MKKLILSLGSGGVRGFTHIGVLKALEENSIKVEAFFGTSVGSLVSVFSASGLSAVQIEELALTLKPLSLIDLTFPKNGYLKGQKLNFFVEKNIQQKNIQDLHQKVNIVATNTHTGKIQIFKSGKISDAVQASCAIPGVFRPVLIDGVEYLDGDLKSPVPLQIARADYSTDIIFGVNIIARIEQAPRNNRQWSKWIAKDIYRRTIVEHELQHADIYLDLDIGYFGNIFGDWPRQQIEIGYRETLKIIPRLKQLLYTV
jgi:NTE family protein